MHQGIRLLGISVSGFDTSGAISLFREEVHKESLYAAIDAIKKRFGEQGITKAHLLKKDCAGDGDKDGEV